MINWKCQRLIHEMLAKLNVIMKDFVNKTYLTVP